MIYRTAEIICDKCAEEFVIRRDWGGVPITQGDLLEIGEKNGWAFLDPGKPGPDELCPDCAEADEDEPS